MARELTEADFEEVDPFGPPPERHITPPRLQSTWAWLDEIDDGVRIENALGWPVAEDAFDEPISQEEFYKRRAHSSCIFPAGHFKNKVNVYHSPTDMALGLEPDEEIDHTHIEGEAMIEGMQPEPKRLK